MNITNTDNTPPSNDSERQDVSTAALTDKPTEARPSAGTRAWISRLAVNMNRMAVDEAFRKEIEKKIF
jgi:hypothetical protein